jgi:uroporphyrinogen decarboxylase
MAEMTPRERVLAALNHQEPDRVPVDFGGGYSTSIIVEGYERLKARLGVGGETQMLSSLFRISRLDEAVFQRLGSDVRPLVGKGRHNWTPPPSAPGTLIDEWGITWKQADYGNGTYWDVIASPLAEATIDDLETYPWPDPLDPGMTAGLGEEARDLHEGTDYAVLADSGFQSHWELAYMLRGYEQLLMDLVEDPAFVHALMAKLLEINKAATGRFLDLVGPYIDVLRTSDDLGTQRGPIMSLDTYRQLVKPYFKEYVSFCRSKTDAKIFYHSCGNVADLVDDLVDAGVEVLNPVQVAALGDTAPLKARFGDRIVFWGGIDTQHVLPLGSVADVEEEVRRRIRDLAPGGGYVLASVHNIQPDVPPENILAMADEARTYGRYPIMV